MRSLTTLALSLGLLTPNVAAVCTGWRQLSVYQDTGSRFSIQYSVAVENKICPANETEPCTFDSGKEYDVSCERHLLAQKQGPTTKSLDDIDAEEAEAIYAMAERGFYEKFGIYSDDTGERKRRQFITRTGKVSPVGELSRGFFDIQPGKKSTLEWVFFYQFSEGRLSNCTNKTLEDVVVSASSPYLFRDPEKGNRTVLAGTWTAGYENITDTDESAAVSVRAFSGGASYGVLVVGLILGLVL
ncbi:hypothetical protein GGS20DRAFT_533337 [Poronia punctata]|nr:hypothetical protein GGS20DRAFT_533337 [Poronia punctata]